MKLISKILVTLFLVLVCWFGWMGTAWSPGGGPIQLLYAVILLVAAGLLFVLWRPGKVKS